MDADASSGSIDSAYLKPLGTSLRLFDFWDRQIMNISPTNLEFNLFCVVHCILAKDVEDSMSILIWFWHESNTFNVDICTLEAVLQCQQEQQAEA